MTATSSEISYTCRNDPAIASPSFATVSGERLPRRAGSSRRLTESLPARPARARPKFKMAPNKGRGQRLSGIAHEHVGRGRDAAFAPADAGLRRDDESRVAEAEAAATEQRAEPYRQNPARRIERRQEYGARDHQHRPQCPDRAIGVTRHHPACDDAGRGPRHRGCRENRPRHRGPVPEHALDIGRQEAAIADDERPESHATEIADGKDTVTPKLEWNDRVGNAPSSWRARQQQRERARCGKCGQGGSGLGWSPGRQPSSRRRARLPGVPRPNSRCGHGVTLHPLVERPEESSRIVTIPIGTLSQKMSGQ